MRALFLKSFTHLERTLQMVSLRLCSRVESEALASEVNNARMNLRAIEETFAEVQEERVAATAAILLGEAQLRETVIAAEKALRERLGPTTPTMYSMHAAPSELMRNPSLKERLQRVRSFLSSLDHAPSSLGFMPIAANIRQRLFALEDALLRHGSLLLAEARAQSERRIALENAQRLLQRLSLQAKLLFPNEPYLLDPEQPLPKAA
jgi:hypothetical protein